MEQIVKFSRETSEGAVTEANEWLAEHADVEVVTRQVVYLPETFFFDAECTIFIWYKKKT